MGSLIKTRVEEEQTEMSRICKFLKCTEEKVMEMYDSESIDSEILLRWSKLLKYDFFRLYSQHLILYAPPVKPGVKKEVTVQSKLPQFRKNTYSKQVIEFILELIETGEKNKAQIIDEYKIPKTTLYKWLDKYKKDK